MAAASPARELFVFVMLIHLGHVFCEVMYLETGTDHTFNPKVNNPPGFETILWKYKSDKVVEYEFVNNVWIPSWYRFKDRGNLNTENGKFTLRNLQKTDSGLYESEIQVNKKLQYSTHDVRVIDAVPKPNVTCDANSTTVTLKCSVDSSVQVNFQWSGPNGFTASKATIIVPNDDTTPNQKLFYICSVDNELKKAKITDFYLSTCKKESSDSGSGVIIGTVVPILAIVFAGLGGFVFYLKKKKQSPKEKGYDKPNDQNDENACANTTEMEVNVNKGKDLEKGSDGDEANPEMQDGVPHSNISDGVDEKNTHDGGDYIMVTEPPPPDSSGDVKGREEGDYINVPEPPAPDNSGDVKGRDEGVYQNAA